MSTFTSSQCHPLVTMTTSDIPFCYSIIMYPYFAYNLITSPFLVLNGYVNNSVSGTEVGITQVGFVIQLKGVGGTTHVFRGWVDGRRVRLGIEEVCNSIIVIIIGEELKCKSIFKPYYV